MLRIKDNVDFKELEKFGFENNDECYCYKLNNADKENLGEGYIIVNPFSNDAKPRQIVFNNLYDGKSETDYIDDIYDCDILFDLIEAGLVEKVEV